MSNDISTARKYSYLNVIFSKKIFKKLLRFKQYVVSASLMNEDVFQRTFFLSMNFFETLKRFPTKLWSI